MDARWWAVQDSNLRPPACTAVQNRKSTTSANYRQLRGVALRCGTRKSYHKFHSSSSKVVGTRDKHKIGAVCLAFLPFLPRLRIHTSRLASFLQNGLQPIKAINRHLSPEKWKPSLGHLPVGQNGITFRPATSCSCLVKHEGITGYFEHVKTLWNLLTPSEVSASCLLLHLH